jgi:hypothetical protein
VKDIINCNGRLNNTKTNVFLSDTIKVLSFSRFLKFVNPINFAFSTPPHIKLYFVKLKYRAKTNGTIKNSTTSIK